MKNMQTKLLFIFLFFFSFLQISAFTFKKDVNGTEKIFTVKNDPKLTKIFEFFNVVYFDNKVDILEVGWTDYDGWIASTFFDTQNHTVMFAISKPRTDKLKTFEDLSNLKKYDWLICHELIHGYLAQYEKIDTAHTSKSWKEKADWFRKKKGINIIDK